RRCDRNSVLEIRQPLFFAVNDRAVAVHAERAPRRSGSGEVRKDGVDPAVVCLLRSRLTRVRRDSEPTGGPACKAARANGDRPAVHFTSPARQSLTTVSGGDVRSTTPLMRKRPSRATL